MAAATLNGVTVTSCTVSIPAYGIWWATVELDQPAALSGAVTLVLADLTLKGTVMSGGPWQGRARYRIAGGAGGWGKSLAAKPGYANDAGVKLRTVIGDAARECGEAVGTIPVGVTGSYYVRAEGPAVRVLHDLAPRAWYVDEAGVTQFGRRPKVTYSGGATRLTPVDLSRGTLDLAPTTIADLLPGVVVDGLEAVDVEHTLDTKLRTTIYGRGIADTSRLSTAFERIVETFTAEHRFYAPWEYRVVLRTDEFYDLQAVRASSGMPDLRHVRIRPGVAGCRSHPQLGSLVLVSFINGDAARPVVTGFDDVYSPGFVADEIALQAGDPGSYPIEHATSAEAVVLMAQQLAVAIGTVVTAAGGPGAYLGAAIAALATDINVAQLVLSTHGVVLGALTLEQIAIELAAKTAATTAAHKPGVGWPKVMGG
jgi:hypothetical protein